METLCVIPKRARAGGVPKRARAGGARERGDALAKVHVVVVVTSAGGFVAPGILRSALCGRNAGPRVVRPGGRNAGAQVVVHASNVDPGCAVGQGQVRWAHAGRLGRLGHGACELVSTHTQVSMSIHSVLFGATQAFTDARPPVDVQDKQTAEKTYALMKGVANVPRNGPRARNGPSQQGRPAAALGAPHRRRRRPPFPEQSSIAHPAHTTGLVNL